MNFTFPKLIFFLFPNFTEKCNFTKHNHIFFFTLKLTFILVQVSKRDFHNYTDYHSKISTFIPLKFPAILDVYDVITYEN